MRSGDFAEYRHLRGQRAGVGEHLRFELQIAGIELPLWMSYVGVPIFSVIGAWVTHEFFGVPWLLAFTV